MSLVHILLEVIVGSRGSRVGVLVTTPSAFVWFCLGVILLESGVVLTPMCFLVVNLSYSRVSHLAGMLHHPGWLVLSVRVFYLIGSVA